MEGILKVIEHNVISNTYKLAIEAGSKEFTYKNLYDGFKVRGTFVENRLEII